MQRTNGNKNQTVWIIFKCGVQAHDRSLVYLHFGPLLWYIFLFKKSHHTQKRNPQDFFVKLFASTIKRTQYLLSSNSASNQEGYTFPLLISSFRSSFSCFQISMFFFPVFSKVGKLLQTLFFSLTRRHWTDFRSSAISLLTFTRKINLKDLSVPWLGKQRVIWTR